jgi:DNA polymerase
MSTTNDLWLALKQIGVDWLGCADCSLVVERKNQVFHRVRGALEVSRGILLVGEAPGRSEDIRAEPFVGPAGKYLDNLLDQSGIMNCLITNVVACKPPKNRNPRKSEIRACMGRLHRMVRAHRPAVILAAGKVAGSTLIGRDLAAKTLVKRIYPWRLGDLDAYVVPIYHPAFLVRRRSKKFDDLTVVRMRIAKRIAKEGILI